MAFGSLPSVLGSGGGTAYSLIGGTGLFADGTAAAPSISFASQTNKGFYSRSSNQIGVSIAGTDSLVFTSGGGLQGTSSNGVIFNSSGGALLFAGGVNQNITLTPSGTGGLVASSAAGQRVSFGDSVFLNSSWGSGSLAIGPSTTDKVVLGWINASYTGSTIGSHNTALNAWTALHYAATSHTFRIAETSAIYLNASGRLIIGNGTTDSGALLQIGTNTTTSAGGIVFGTDTFLYRNADGSGCLTISGVNNAVLSVDGTAGATQGFQIKQAGTIVAGMRTTSSTSLILSSGANTTALTLDASQNATFAAAIQTVSVVGFGVTALSSTFVGIGAGTTGRSSLRIPHGVAPTSPVDGDMWTTTAGAFIRINGVTKTFTLI